MDIAKLNGGFGIAFFIPCFDDLEYVYTHKPADKVVNLFRLSEELSLLVDFFFKQEGD